MNGIHRKARQRLAAVLATVLILSGSFPVFAAGEAPMPEETETVSENAEMYGEDSPPPEIPAESTEEESFPVPEEPPAFHARIEYRMGYTVIGTFTDFTPDITLVQTLYSLDNEHWQTAVGGGKWNLYNLDSDDEDKLKTLQDQPCLFDAHEPLRSYLAGETDRFYVKLYITRKNGLSYDTQPALIERGGLQPVPEGARLSAFFPPASQSMNRLRTLPTAISGMENTSSPYPRMPQPKIYPRFCRMPSRSKSCSTLGRGLWQRAS